MIVKKFVFPQCTSLPQHEILQDNMKLQIIFYKFFYRNLVNIIKTYRAYVTITKLPAIKL